MRDITVGEDDLLGAVFGEQARKFLFGVDGDAFGVMGAGQFRRINTIANEGDLSGSKSDDMISGMVSEESVEIMKISSPRPKDDDPDGFTFRGVGFRPNLRNAPFHRVVQGRGRKSFP
jgi:hypothetical protein